MYSSSSSSQPPRAGLLSFHITATAKVVVVAIVAATTIATRRTRKLMLNITINYRPWTVCVCAAALLASWVEHAGGENSKWLHHPCLLGVPMAGRTQPKKSGCDGATKCEKGRKWVKLCENPNMPYPQCGRSIKPYTRGNNDAPSITKHQSLVRLDTQTVAPHAHYAKCAPLWSCGYVRRQKLWHGWHLGCRPIRHTNEWEAA